MSKNINKLIRVACYVRVSTEEQKKHGFSVSAQIDKLKNFVEKNKEYILVDFYIDEGVSAVKVKKRLELQRLLQDVRDNKIDLILFTKLDRWGRSVKIYHQMQDVLDEHNVIWKAVDEDYETQTSSGKFKVNIMMSVAQQERDRASERIKDVFEYKIKNGEAIYGNNAMPFGFEIREIDGKKRMVHNLEEEPILHALINHYYTFKTIRKSMMFIQENYGINMLQGNIKNLLTNPLLYGSYRGNDNYCEPYITKEKWDEIQCFIKNNLKVNKSRNVYLFSRLIVCPECGKKLCGCSATYKYANGDKIKKYYYRCDYKWTRNTCSFSKNKAEVKIEEELLDKLSIFMTEHVSDIKFKEKKQKPKKKIDEDSVKKELDRLNNMYLKGRIEEEEYDKRYNELNDKLKEVSEKPQIKASEKVMDLMGVNLREIYDTFTKEEKQAFWNGLLKAIYIDENFDITGVDFL